MGTLTFDFEFVENSLLHGEFLTEVYRSCTDVTINKVNNHHKNKSGAIFLSVAVPEDVATVLKLRFGQCIVIRPPKEDDQEYVKALMKQKYRALEEEYRYKYEYDRMKISDPYIYDYIDILGPEKKTKEEKMIKDEYYEEMKKIAKFKLRDLF